MLYDIIIWLCETTLNTILYYLSLLTLSEMMVDLSSLTRVQVETMKIHLAVRKSEISMREALGKRKKSKISRGTHYRILAQAKKNIRESLFTIAIAVQVGLLKPEDIQRLIASVVVIPVDLEPARLPEVLSLVRALAERIVMF
jgi:hypothetical protein